MNINRDSVGWSSAIFQKISSECNIDKQHNRNIIWSLLFLQNDFNKENPGTKISGYIQIIQASPFSVLAYTQEGVRIYHNMCRTQCLHLDTNGTILSMKRTMFEKAKPLLFTSCQTPKTKITSTCSLWIHFCTAQCHGNISFLGSLSPCWTYFVWSWQQNHSSKYHHRQEHNTVS